jgi:hypothetical protein
MKTKRVLLFGAALFSGLTLLVSTHAALRETTSDDAPRSAPNDNAEEALMETPNSEAATKTEGMQPAEETPAAPQPKKTGKKILSGSDGFIAGPDWEFDGFVAGGQGQEVRSMYVTNDLLYLNVGFAQGIQSGDRIGIYRRGDRIRDPQTGRFIGYEVRRIGVSEITDKIDDETCSARVMRANDGIEVGDLVRREQVR